MPVSTQPMPPGVPAESWPARHHTAALYGITPAKLASDVRHHKLQQYEDATGVRRFKPDDLHLLYGPPKRTVPTAAKDPVARLEPDELEVASQVDALQHVVSHVSAWLKEARVDRQEAIKQAAAERERLLELVLAPASALNECMMKTLADMRSELERWRDVGFSLMQQREELLSEHSVREAFFEEQKASRKHRSELVELLKPELAAFLQRVGVQSPFASELREAQTFFAGLDSTMIRIVLESGQLTDAQKAFVYKHRPDLKPGEPEKDSAPKGATTNGVQQ